MAKMALVAKTADVLAVSHQMRTYQVRIIDKHSRKTMSHMSHNGDGILDLNFHLQDRANCETDLTVLQLLPYITVVDADTNKIFTYKRGGSGNEDRLVGLHSIGLGGHIEEAPNHAAYIIDVITMNVVRELNEEVGLDMTASLFGKVRDMIIRDQYTFMYAPDEDVGKYHLCMWFVIKISKDDFGNHEDNIITEGIWLSLEELEALNKSEVASLEGWSKHCLGLLKELRHLESQC